MSCPTGNATAICSQLGGAVVPFTPSHDVLAIVAKYKGAELTAESDGQELVIRAGDKDTCRKAAKRVQSLYKDGFSALWQNQDGTYSVIVNRERAIQKIIGQVRELPFERLYLLSKWGIQFHIDGDEYEFIINTSRNRQIQEARDYADFISIHNHPGLSLPPSGQDFANGMINRERESYVVTNNGTFLIRYREGGVKGAEINKFRRVWAKHQAEVFGPHFPAYREEICADEQYEQNKDDPEWIGHLAELRMEVIRRTGEESGFFTLDFVPHN